MLSKISSYGLVGLEGFPITIETDVYNGFPSYDISGLADASVKESKERVRSAIQNSGLSYPTKKITINLAPADRRKEGSVYDLAIALGLLSASEQVSTKHLEDAIVFGELSLDGEIRPINGLLPMVIDARKNGYSTAIIPFANRKEIECISGIRVLAISHLKEVVAILNEKNEPNWQNNSMWQLSNVKSAPIVDFCNIKGQESAKRAMEIAASGGHNILLVGVRGSGKSMIAKALPGILPDLTFEEVLQITQIHSIAGELQTNRELINTRPFRSPHYTSSPVAIIGGGSKALPGEISLAHYGVLYFDELPEYPRNVLESLRQPLEDGIVSISRANIKISYPANFMFVASMNPCPCGNLGSKDTECRCSPNLITRYLSKISGPLLDRMDLHIEMGRVQYDELQSAPLKETSADVKKRVDIARKIQLERYAKEGIYCNAQLSSTQIAKYCKADEKTQALLKGAYEKLRLSARSYTRLLLIARTIADLEQSENITVMHMAEAIQYRNLERKYWGNQTNLF